MMIAEIQGWISTASSLLAAVGTVVVILKSNAMHVTMNSRFDQMWAAKDKEADSREQVGFGRGVEHERVTAAEAQAASSTVMAGSAVKQTIEPADAVGLAGNPKPPEQA